MKLLPLALLALMLAGCCESQVNTTHPKEPAQKTSSSMNTVWHDGHAWIIYQDWADNKAVGGIVHHPDCPCRKEVER